MGDRDYYRALGMYDDDGYDDYSPVEHMMNDPVDFQMHGYGGFGYDTSHVPPDEATPELTKLVERGDIVGVKRLVGQVESKDKAKVVNYARRWTEVDYRMSGFTKEYEWFDVTALTAAAILGHHDIVQYLLEQEADPTLSGCPGEDIYSDAMKAANGNLSLLKRKTGENAWDNARSLVSCAQRCVDLLEAAQPFWQKATYSQPQYSKNARAKFTNAPTDRSALRAALRAIPALDVVPPRSLSTHHTSSSAGPTTKGSKKTKDESSQPSPKKKGAKKTKDRTSGNGRVCATCQAAKPLGSFSKNQRTKKADAKCKDCVAGLNEAQQRSGKRAQKAIEQREEEQEELSWDIDEGIEIIREDAKYRLREMEDNAFTVDELAANIPQHGRASEGLKKKVQKMKIAYDRSSNAMAEVVKLILEIEKLAIDEEVVPEE